VAKSVKELKYQMRYANLSQNVIKSRKNAKIFNKITSHTYYVTPSRLNCGKLHKLVVANSQRHNT